jgi:DNA-binding IclR family transcriptional regulator
MPPVKKGARAKPSDSPVSGAGLIKSVDKTISIIGELHAAHRPLRISELAKSLSLSPSVVSRIVSTLVQSGMVDQDEETGRIQLGLALVILGHAALGRRKLDYIAIPVMARLTEQFKEYVSLSRLVRGRVVMMRGGPVEAMERETFLTTVVPIHASAPGKLLAAWESPESVAAIIATHGMDPLTPNTITSAKRFEEELAVVRKAQFAIDNEEIVAGMRHIAAPIFDHQGKLIAALSAGGPVEKVKGEELERLQSALAGAALQISRQMGFPAARALP